MQEYTEEIERLRKDLQASRDKNGIYLAQENYDAMQTEILQQKDRLQEFMEKIDALNVELIKVCPVLNLYLQLLLKYFLEST